MPIVDQLCLVLAGVTLGLLLADLIATTPRKERK